LIILIPKAGYENTEYNPFPSDTIADTAGKVLPVFHISIVSKQLPSSANLLAIYH
jgi:hypothetical protein